MLLLLHNFFHVAAGGSDARGMLGIIWSCAATVVLSAWVAVRPNQGNDLWERVELMIGTIMVPEFTLVWAIKQLYSAYRVKSMFEGWTLAHAYFLIMGGFSVLDRHDQSRILTFEDFYRGFSVLDQDNAFVLTFDFRHGSCVKADTIEGRSRKSDSDIPTFTFRRGFPVLASEDFLRSISRRSTTMPKKIILGEINGMSQREGLLHLVAVHYALWFIVRCFARMQFGLAVTELEFSTLVLVLLHVIIYLVWWHKPIGVHEAMVRPAQDVAEFGIIPAAAILFLSSTISITSLNLCNVATGVCGLDLCSIVIRVCGLALQANLSTLYFCLVPILKFFASIGRIVFGLYYIVIDLPFIHNSSLVPAILRTCSPIMPSIRYLNCCLDRANNLPFILDAFAVLAPIIILFTTLFIHRLPDSSSEEEVKLAESSGYILKSFKRLILATWYFSEKGLLGVINVPVLCIGFILLLAFSPFALIVAFALHFTTTTEILDPESPVVRSSTFQARGVVMTAALPVRESFNFILTAPDWSQFGVIYYILFIPLTLPVTLLFPFIVSFNLILVMERFTSAFAEFFFTDYYPSPHDKQVPIFYAPFPKDARYPCLAAASVVGLIFFGLYCIGWNFQISNDFKLQMSWLVTWLAIFVIPIIAMPLILTLRDVTPADPTEGSSLTNLIAQFLFLVYSCARISTIPQAIVLLILKTRPSAVEQFT